MGRLRPHRRAFHRQQRHERLHELTLFPGDTGTLARRRRAHQLLLDALDLSQPRVGRDLPGGALAMAAPPGRAERALLLDRLAHPRPGVWLLRRTQDLERAADGGGCLDPGGQCPAGPHCKSAGATAPPSSPDAIKQPPAGGIPGIMKDDSIYPAWLRLRALANRASKRSATPEMLKAFSA